MILALTNNLTNRRHEIEVTDNGTSAIFWRFDAVTLPADMDDGEYTCELLDDAGEVVYCGLARVGDYRQEVAQAPTNNQFIQYER